MHFILVQVEVGTGEKVFEVLVESTSGWKISRVYGPYDLIVEVPVSADFGRASAAVRQTPGVCRIVTLAGT